MLRAQRAVQTLAARSRRRAGREIVRAPRDAGRRRRWRSTASALEADRVVWSCGGWLAGLFPDIVTLPVTRQELVLLRRRPRWRERARVGRLRPRRPTAPATSTTSASRSRGTSRARRLDPDADLRRARPRSSGGPATTCADRFPALADGAPDRPRRPAATSSRPTRTSSPPPHPEHPACGSSAAAPATASSTARRWPSGSPPPGTAATPLPPRFALGDPRARARRSGARGRT